MIGVDERVQNLNQETLDIIKKILDVCEGENGIAVYLAVESVKQSVLEHFLDMHKDNIDLQMFGALITHEFTRVDLSDTEELLKHGVDPRSPETRYPMEEKEPPKSTRINID